MTKRESVPYNQADVPLRKPTIIILTLPDNKQITIDLLDCVVEKKKTQITTVSGLHYDIF